MKTINIAFALILFGFARDVHAQRSTGTDGFSLDLRTSAHFVRSIVSLQQTEAVRDALLQDPGSLR